MKRLIESNISKNIYNEFKNKLLEFVNDVNSENILNLTIKEEIQDEDNYFSGTIYLYVTFSDKLSKYIDIKNHPINLSNELLQKIQELGTDLEEQGGNAYTNNTATIFWFNISEFKERL